MSTKQVQKKANGTKKSTQGKGPKQQQKKPKQNDKEPRMVVAPTAMSRTVTVRKPKIQSQPNGDCRIHHREYLRDVQPGATPTAFNLVSTEINPGLTTSFPWLSQIAQRFEKYSFNSLHYIFETQAPTNIGGTLLMSIDYDASDTPPASKQLAMSYKNSVRASPWNECKHTSAKEDLHQQSQYFVRGGSIPADADIKLYDVGNLFVMTQGITSPDVIGELYVEYDVLLKTPSFTNFSQAGGKFRGAGVLSGQAPFGSTPNSDAQNVGISIDANSVVTFSDVGDYVLAAWINGTSFTSFSVSLGTGISVLPDSNTMIAAGSGSASIFGGYRVTNPATATLDFTAAATSYNQSALWIARAPTNSLSV